MSFRFVREELWGVCAIILQELDFPHSQPTASSVIDFLNTFPEVGKLEDPEFTMAVPFLGIE